MTFTNAQNDALAVVDARMAELSDWCATIFDFGETAWREYRSAEWYVNRLRAEGFSVEEGSGGMPTAFCAEWSNGDGPVIGMYAEYDAVPGNCQAAATSRQPRKGLGSRPVGTQTRIRVLASRHWAGCLPPRPRWKSMVSRAVCAIPESPRKRCAAQSRSMQPKGIMTGWPRCCPSTRSTCCRCAIP